MRWVHSTVPTSPMGMGSYENITVVTTRRSVFPMRWLVVPESGEKKDIVAAGHGVSGHD